MLCEEILNPSLEDALQRAFGKLKEGYFEDAVEGFTECLLVEADEPRAFQGRAMAYFQLKQWHSALADFKRAKELNPEDLENWVGLGLCFATENKIYEAIAVFEELLMCHPYYVRAHIQLGQLYYRLGIISKGHAQMDLGLASRPSLAERRQIEQLKKEQTTLDKKRYYRPDFEALRKKKQAETSGDSWIRKITSFIQQQFRKES